MDPVLHDILRDGIQKFLRGEKQTKYIVNDPEDRGYWRLQENQVNIGWDNLLRGYSKHWRRIQQKYKQKQSEARKLQPQIQQPPSTMTPTKKKTPKRKAGVFQHVFDNITKIILEMWLESNKDHHNPLQGQQRMANLTDAIQTVEELYSLRSHHETTRVDVLCNTPTRNVGTIRKTNVIVGKTVESWYIPEHAPC